MTKMTDEELAQDMYKTLMDWNDAVFAGIAQSDCTRLLQEQNLRYFKNIQDYYVKNRTQTK
jgi:hypothetical protein